MSHVCSTHAQGASDAAVGVFLVVFSAVLFVYYSTWVLVTPFADDDSALHAYFLPYEYAWIIPCILLVVGVTGIAGFVAHVLNKKKNKKKD